MEVRFSSKSSTLISSPPCSLSHFRLSSSLRIEFLAGNLRWRRSGLQSGRTARRFGFRSSPPPKCAFRASLFDGAAGGGGSVVAVTVAVVVAALAAFREMHLNHERRPREDDDSVELSSEKESDDMEHVELSEQFGDANAKGTVNSRITRGEEVHLENQMKERKNVVVEFSHSTEVHGFNEEEGHLLKFHENGLAHEDTLAAEAQGHQLISPLLGDVVLADTNGGVGANPPLAVVNEPRALELENLQFGVRDSLLERQETPVAILEMPGIATNPSLPHVSVNNGYTEINQANEVEHITSKECEIKKSSHNAVLNHSVEQVSCFNDVTHPGASSTAAERTVHSHIPPLNINGFNTQIRHIQEGTEYLAGNSQSTGILICDIKYVMVSEHGEGQMIDFQNKNGSVSRKKGYVKGKRSSNRERRLPQPKVYKQTRPLLQQNRMALKNSNDPSSSLSTYNQLLRDGRLSDCIELLENMETKGLLDMDKVYHTRFFKMCQSHKAIKEAFRFFKLIKKPTMKLTITFFALLNHDRDVNNYLAHKLVLFEDLGAQQVLQLVKDAGLKPDCKLYTTLISTCAKSGEVDAMFEVFHEMVNAGVEPNVNTYGALIDGCGRAGQVAKAFGAYGIMRSKKVKPDRVIFNALITACGQSGAVDRAFDVFAEMTAEVQPMDPDHVTVGALMKTCAKAGQVDRAHEVYKMMNQFNIKGTAEVYTIAVYSCSQTGNLDFALKVYNDMTRKGVVPDEMFLSSLIDVAGHAGKVDVAFEIMNGARSKGMQLGNMSYSSLMGACCNAKNWQKALELYDYIKSINLLPTVSTMNALITSLCEGDQLKKSVEVLGELKRAGVVPNTITYSGYNVTEPSVSESRKNKVANQLILFTELENRKTSLSIMAYRETIAAGVIPTPEVYSQVLGCLKFPRDATLKNRLIENLGMNIDVSNGSNVSSLLDGFGEVDMRAFAIYEETASLGAVPSVSLKESPIIIDARKLQIHIAEVYLLTVLKGLKHRLAAGARLPSITILLPIEKQRSTPTKDDKPINLTGRVGQAVTAMLRRLRLPYQGNESFGKIRITGLSLRRWFKPRLNTLTFGSKPMEFSSSMRLAKGIIDQQRSIRNSNLSLE
ncbi:Pentatricopeptide repeat-containing protein [Acorus gramineus]|uniref:Pentatricopeptide repeat-containing protein n=1 Tax=Acorus gramineus TaxID=55184 RepID=A0AAV9B9D7_ACOGR|nr:Pentatricopeptide repeat-containing protein [Acorus gramineus]